jgi:hypothetical protein
VWVASQDKRESPSAPPLLPPTLDESKSKGINPPSNTHPHTTPTHHTHAPGFSSLTPSAPFSSAAGNAISGSNTAEGSEADRRRRRRRAEGKPCWRRETERVDRISGGTSRSSFSLSSSSSMGASPAA